MSPCTVKTTAQAANTAARPKTNVAAEVVHVGGASHGGRLFRENVSGHLRYLSLHGRPGEAERARRLLRASLLVRGRLHGGDRGRLYREVAAWLGSGDAESLIA